VVVLLLGAVAALIFYMLRWPFGRGEDDAGLSRFPVVRVESGTAEYSVDYVEPGTKHSVVFAIHNKSKVPTGIKRVRSDCDCLKVPAPPAVLAGDATTQVKVDFDAPKEARNYSQKVVLQTEGPKNPQIVLLVLARVGMPLECEPEVVNLGKLIAGELRYGTLTILNRSNVPIHPAYATTTDPACITHIPRAPVPPGGKLQVPLSARARSGQPSKHKAKLDIHTDCQGQPRFAVNVEYEIAGNFMLSEGSIDLGGLRPGQRRLVSFKITSAQENPGNFVHNCSMEELSNLAGIPSLSYAGPEATVQCDVTAGNESRPVRGVIHLELSDWEGSVAVPVTGHVVSQGKDNRKEDI
jgi:hypothetical protein